MTTEDLIEAASKAGFETKRDMILVDLREITPTLTRFAALVAAAEREACARACETQWSTEEEKTAGRVFAAEIRARGNK